MSIPKHKQKTPLNRGESSIAAHLSAKVLRAQRRLANYLNRKTARMNAQDWMLVLIGFCLLLGSYCLYLLMQVFF
ncbi:hypothetical protein [Pedobacter sp. GR22-6]|uniref:hypothetical protein n=1 Tax=Pedobacter sp. GR22-6 TaxID=3127957 RepID=UPI00307FAC71